MDEEHSTYSLSRPVSSWVQFGLWVVLPLANFLYWLRVGHLHSVASVGIDDCPKPSPVVLDIPCEGFSRRRQLLADDGKPLLIGDSPALELVLSETMTAYKYEQLARMRYPLYSTLVNHHPSVMCESYVNPHVSQKHISNKQGSCMAVVAIDSPGITSSYNLLRFDEGPRWNMMTWDKTGEVDAEERPVIQPAETKVTSSPLPANTKAKHFMPSGFFTKSGTERGRQRLREKMGPFLRLLDIVREVVLRRLVQGGFSSSGGQDITIMVVNEGELDLLLNFVCSCKQNNVSMSNILVFAGSSGVVRTVEALGVGMMSVFHTSFGSVSKDASAEYLDRIFVDMMWYKAFSVWILLSLRFNVLFQDVDLVWFREPFSYFREYIQMSKQLHFGQHPEAFFSDDGQRGLRYSPFYANSGFYYLAYSQRTLFFAWTIMTAFDILHVSGSHQNVFTSKLIENMDLARISPKLLSLDLFSTGVKFHHDKPFMRGIKEGYEHPYNFHMCWTLNKKNKIDYFKKAQMWYVKAACAGEENSGGLPRWGVVDKCCQAAW